MKALIWFGLIAGGLAYLVLSWFVSDLLLDHHRRPPGDTPALLDLAWEDIRLTTADGVELVGWVVEPDGLAAGTVLVFHGLGSMKQVLPLWFLADLGLRGVAIDLRGHGQSGASLTSFGWFERRDVIAAVNYVRGRWPGEPVAAWGQSLGAAAIAFASDVTSTLEAVVLEGCYADAELAWRTRVDGALPPWLRPAARLPRTLIERRLGLPASLLRPVTRLAQFSPDRLLLVRSERDQMVTEAEFAWLVAAAPGATVMTAPGAAHGDALVGAGSIWRAQFADYLLSRLRSPRAVSARPAK